VLFRGCIPEVAAGPDGRILAVGAGAQAAAGPDAEIHQLRGRALPGLADAHLHLEGMAAARLGLELAGARSLEDALARIRAQSSRLSAGAWLVGRGWYNDAWPDPAFPNRSQLDSAAAGRPAFLVRKDGHSAWVSSAALRAAGVGPGTEAPPGGGIDRDASGEPSGILRDNAVELVQRLVPPPGPAELDEAIAASLRSLARLGVTSAHSMDTSAGFSSLQRLASGASLPVRVTYNLPAADLKHAERMGVRSGWGDDRLRIWGVKAFLDGSLGSRTALMLDGSGLSLLPPSELADLARRCAAAGLNICLHAIGDAAVRRALDALEPLAGSWSQWRPRIEHAQCVDPADMRRFRVCGAVASMQPIHAVSDRELADRIWGARTSHAYAWRELAQAGAVLAFGSDAPVEPADPVRGLDAATTWRRRAGWHPQLALSPAAALRAYTWGPAYAVGLERELGRLRPGLLCDLTVIDRGRVEASIVGGRVSWRRRPD
jgi:predicted amidohydrolase YtcJ